jgi:hypothetical protein
MIFPLAGERMIEIPPGQGLVSHKQIDGRH